jgi:hypothetical protein
MVFRAVRVWAHGDDWECPCGLEPPKPGSTLAPTQTVVSLREPTCPFCGRKFREEYPRA